MPTGYKVQIPGGGITGWGGTSPQYAAFDEETAGEYIRRYRTDYGGSEEDFELLPFEAEFVEGVNAERYMVKFWETTGFGSRGRERE